MGKENLLLKALPVDVFHRIEPELTRVSLPRAKVLHYPGEPIRNLYFPLDCVISVTVTMNSGQTAEAGVVGNREVAGINALMGGRETTQTEYVVQIPGDAMKISAGPLREEFDRNTQLRDAMLKYTQAFIAQMSQNVACNRLHDIKHRFARWLLEARDRIQSDELHLTQEYISQMLGVRRAGVNIIANQFQEMGIIRISRGLTDILDGRGLEDMSCECYALLKDEYDRLLGLRN